MMKIADTAASADGTKYLWQLGDGHTIESVYFRSIHSTRQACVSTQIGCNVGCRFCETGKQKSLRNLDASEIVEQVRQTLSDQGHDGPLDALSFAGMGEPLHNFDAVAAASATIKSERLAKQIICFTSGVAPRIPQVADTQIDTLYVSLHATTDEVRERLIPTNRKYPIGAILEASRQYVQRAGRRVWINYLLLSGVNDSLEDAARLANLIDPIRFSVRLCHWNAVDDREFACSGNGGPFLAVLQSRGLPATLEAPYREARNVGGGCGQLRSRSV